MPPVVSHPPPPPPLSGHLRCISASSGTPMWPRRFPSDLPCRIGFRSIEFREIHCDQGQRILDRCADAPEKFTICIGRKGEKGGRLAHPSWTMSRLELITPVPGYGELGHLPSRFYKNTSLRSIVIRTPFFNLPVLNLKPSRANLLSDASLSRSEFVLELSGLPSEFTQPSRTLWGNWDEIDKMFEKFLGSRPEFKVVIRTGRLYNRDKFQAQARERFPLIAGRDRLRFETCLVVDR